MQSLKTSLVKRVEPIQSFKNKAKNARIKILRSLSTCRKCSHHNKSNKMGLNNQSWWQTLPTVNCTSQVLKLGRKVCAATGSPPTVKDSVLFHVSFVIWINNSSVKREKSWPSKLKSTPAICPSSLFHHFWYVCLWLKAEVIQLTHSTNSYLFLLLLLN